MSIVCQLCNQKFEKLISSTHLKFSHQMTSSDYKTQFGQDSLACPEYRARRSLERSGANNPMFGRTHTDHAKSNISKINKGKISHNKGSKVTDPAHLRKLREGIDAREGKYKAIGYHPRRGAVISSETRELISNSVREYAQAHPNEIKTRAQKILQTKKDQGFDFGSPMRGKKLSDESKKKISDISIQTGLEKREQARQRYEEFAVSANLKINGYANNVVSLSCLNCSNPFEFTAQYLTESKFRKDICPYCREQKTKSIAEVEILDFVRTIVKTTVLSGNRSQIFPLELDIYLPDQKIAIEYCGLYWHSELRGKQQDYHLTKLRLCQEKGIRLVTIFEDEWTHHPVLVKSRLRTILGCTNNIIAARKCQVKEIDNGTARTFCQINHSQGAGSASISLGLYYLNALVSVMTFSKPSISKGSKSSLPTEWELNRFCTLIDHRIVGGASRLFSKFVREHLPTKIITYADLRWNTGNLYQVLNFELVGQTPPNYWYIDFAQTKRIHRFGKRKNSGDNPALTEWQNRQLQGWDRIWDCGNTKWIWSKK